MTGPDYTRAELARIAADARRKPETRRAAADILSDLVRLDIRLALDSGCATHEARQGDTSDVVATLGPAPEGEGRAMPAFQRVTP